MARLFRLFMVLLAMLFADANLHGAERFVVVIDAGHGGIDRGAELNGVVEKDVNLNIALAVQRLIKDAKVKGLECRLTRQADVAIGLAQRAGFANAVKASLLISIHTNSLGDNEHMHGVVTYVPRYQVGTLLSAGKNANSDENKILDKLRREANKRNSIDFGSRLQKNLVGEGSRIDLGVLQENFVVLREAKMPSVLVEVGFLSNKTEAAFVGSAGGQMKLASTIAQTIIDFVASNGN